MASSKAKEKVRTETIYLQLDGKEASLDAIKAAIQEDYDAVKEGKDTPTDVRIYLKPEDTKAYYVINDDFAGEVALPLA
mgnify:CR=1 FL=1